MGCASMRVCVLTIFGLVLSVLGIIGLIMGGVLPGIVDKIAEGRVEDEIIISQSAETESGWNDFNNGTLEAQIVFYNLTNRQQIQANPNVKPRFKRVTYPVWREDTKYNARTDGSSYTYELWTRFSPRGAAGDLMHTDRIVQVNPLFVEHMSKYGAGSEQKFAELSSQVVVSKLASEFLADHSDFMTATRTVMIRIYLRAMTELLTGSPYSMSEAEIRDQWARADPSSDLLATTHGNDFLGFELGATVPTDHATKLLDTSEALSIAGEGSVVWADAMACRQEAECAAKDSLVAAYSQATFDTVAAWIDLLALSQAADVYQVYLQRIVSTIKDDGALTPTVNVGTWVSLGALQFGRGTIVKALTGGAKTSVADVNMVPAGLEGEVEYFAWAAAQSQPVELDAAQAGAFLNTFGSAEPQPMAQNPQNLTYSGFFFGLRYQDPPVDPLDAAQMAAKGLTPVYNKYAATGATDADLLAEYLSTYLVGCLIKGVESAGSGLFVTRSPWELLYGWNEPLLAGLGKEPFYPGLVGPYHASLQDHLAAQQGQYKQEYGWNTGASVLDKRGSYIRWKNVQEVDTVDTIEGDCFADMTGAVLHQCKVWAEPEPAIGVAADSWKPMMQDETIESTIPVWRSSVGRALHPHFHKERRVQDIDTRLYRVCASPDYVAEGNAKFFVPTDGVLPLGSLVGSPMFGALEMFFGMNQTESGKFAGVTKNDWDADMLEWEYWANELGSYLYYEPVTGQFIRRREAEHTGIMLDRAELNVWNADLLSVSGNAGGHYYWPYHEVAHWDEIASADAADLRDELELLDATVYARSWSFIGGGVLLLLGIVLLCLACYFKANPGKSEGSGDIDMGNYY